MSPTISIPPARPHTRRVGLSLWLVGDPLRVSSGAGGAVRLLQPDLAGKKLPTIVANIAYHLSLIQDKDPILLPIDQLREFLQQRKIVVSGVVQRLVEAGVLSFQDRNYRTGKAREFRFTGKSGEHFEIRKASGGTFLNGPRRLSIKHALQGE